MCPVSRFFSVFISFAFTDHSRVKIDVSLSKCATINAAMPVEGVLNSAGREVVWNGLRKLLPHCTCPEFWACTWGWCASGGWCAHPGVTRSPPHWATHTLTSALNSLQWARGLLEIGGSLQSELRVPEDQKMAHRQGFAHSWCRSKFCQLLIQARWSLNQ